MITELFISTLSKKEQLESEIKRRGFMRTSEVIKWGLDNFCNRAERNARQLCRDGKIRRLSHEEQVFRGYNTKEEVWASID